MNNTSPSCLCFGFACLLLALAVPASAGESRFNIVKLEDLNYGSMVVISPGDVILEPSRTGHRSGTAKVVTPSALNNNFGSAKFSVTCTRVGKDRQAVLNNIRGGGRLKYTLSLETIPTSIDGPSIQMALSNFQTYSSSGQLSNERVVSNCNNYTETIYVGATLSVGLSQPSGHYISSNNILLVVLDTSD